MWTALLALIVFVLFIWWLVKRDAHPSHNVDHRVGNAPQKSQVVAVALGCPVQNSVLSETYERTIYQTTYRMTPLHIDISRHDVRNITCPECGASVNLVIWPGLPLLSALGSALGWLAIGVMIPIIGAIFNPVVLIGILIIPPILFFGVAQEHRKLIVKISEDKNEGEKRSSRWHELFRDGNTISTRCIEPDQLAVREAYWSKFNTEKNADAADGSAGVQQPVSESLTDAALRQALTEDLRELRNRVAELNNSPSQATIPDHATPDVEAVTTPAGRLVIGMAYTEVVDLLGPPSATSTPGDLMSDLAKGGNIGLIPAGMLTSGRLLASWFRPEGSYQLVFDNGVLSMIHSVPGSN